jgi:hypothetical protein
VSAFRSPDFFNTDLTLKKSFQITERISFTAGASAYNVLNLPNFNSPLAKSAFGSEFGTIVNQPQPPISPYGAFASAAVDMRILQLMGKINF